MTSDKGRSVNLGEMKITGDSNGLRICLQSNKDFSFLRDKTTEKTFKLGGVDCWLPRQGNESTLPGIPGCFYTNKDRFQAENYLNLSMFLAKDLDKGVEYQFDSFPLSSEKVKEFGNNFHTQIKLIWATYLRKTSISMTFQANIVDIEEV